MRASRCSFAAANLENQTVETLVALQEASDAQHIALAQPVFSFRSEETLAFIQSWKYAGNEVTELRAEIGNTVTSCYEMLDGLNARAAVINDSLIRIHTIDYVAERRKEYDTAVQKTYNTLNDIESMIFLGNDIIESMRIVGTANLVGPRIEELNQMHQEVINRFSNLNSIVDEGKRLLNIELGKEVII
jgi:hypothetical protein